METEDEKFTWKDIAYGFFGALMCALIIFLLIMAQYVIEGGTMT